jgi:Protein of unknown function (DUF2630)
MNDTDVMSHIEELVEQEQRLLAAGSSGDGLTSEQHARLRAIKIELDRYWDLLRQRRAHDEFGLDADDASLRDAGTVEHYEQ